MLSFFVLLSFALFAHAENSLFGGGLEECNRLCRNGSCCEVSFGKFRCCEYSNGVCCPGGKLCCPQGSLCLSDGRVCEYPTGFEVGLALINPFKEKSAQIYPVVSSAKFKNGYVICSDRSSTCPDNSTCCHMANGSWGCCPLLDAVCCGDNLHCCPRGTKCNGDRGSCDLIHDDPLLHSNAFPFWPALGNARDFPGSRSSLIDSDNNRMSYDGVKCDAFFECPPYATCCHNTTGHFACCPLPEAVCCPDRIHCCPKGTVCDLEMERCIPHMIPGYEPFKFSPTPHYEVNRHVHQLCPDGHSVCLSEQTCCKLSDKTWGCCPLPDAVCCSDGEHCCPAGFKCDLPGHKCLKKVAVPPAVADIACPNEEFRCDNSSTCCPLPNNEWACCPFEKAVCCSDMTHCCPENTSCDVVHNRCVKPNNDFHSMTVSTVEQHDRSFSHVCPSGLVSCPGGTCCKNIFGFDACCPHPEAVCCNNGHCCPKGMGCDDSTRSCLPLAPHWDSVSVPWVNKVSARLVPDLKKQNNVNPPDSLCPDRRSVCTDNRTCCLLIDGSFGCCPLANGTCCADRRHCCPHNSTCVAGGYCVQVLEKLTDKPPFPAERMIATINPSVRSSHLPQSSPKLGEVVHATFCGACPGDWLCCPNAEGLPNQRCCPAPGGVCCSDGEHCCPKGTSCVGNGQCQSSNPYRLTSSAVLLIPSSVPGQVQSNFLHHSFVEGEYRPSSKSFRARVNLLFLLDSYYRDNAHRYALCPDRERYCDLNQKCCPSKKYGYVCVPIDSTCCYPDADTWCPSGSDCSDGRTCKLQCGPA